MKFLNTLSIRTRVISAFVFVTLLSTFVLVTTSASYYTALVARDQAVRTSFSAQQTANIQQVSLQRMNALLQTRYAQVFATIGGTIADPSLEASGALINSDILAREDDFNQTLQLYQQNFTFATSPTMHEIRTIVLSDDPQSTVSQMQQQALAAVAGLEWPRYKALQDQELRLLNTATNPLLTTNPQLAYANAYPVLYEANQLFLDLKLDWQQVVNVEQTIGEIVTRVGPSQTQPILETTLIALVLTVLFVLLVGLMVNRTITHPLSLLIALTQRFGKGDMSARASLWGHDKIYQVASSMNAMLDRIVTLITESEAQRANLHFQVEQLMHDVRGIGQGDLRLYADVQLPDLGILAQSFNFMIHQFSLLIQRVKSVVYEVVASTQHIAHAMGQVVKNAEQQIQLIQEAAELLEHMASASQQSAQSATTLSTVASQARETAHKGATSAQMMVDGMVRVNTTMQETSQKVVVMQEHSSSIDQISQAMGRLVQKTQRLSLDAAIQVSQSHPNPGFTAIVEEIRKLAEQTKKDAEAIRHIARTVTEGFAEVQQAILVTARETNHMSSFASQAGGALAATVTAVEHQATGIHEMAQVVSSQVQLAHKVQGRMQHVAQTTRQSSTAIQEVVRQMSKQEHALLQLRSSVEVFRIHELSNGSKSERSVLNVGKRAE